MACSSGCPTPGVHQSWGECVRGKALKHAVSVPANGHDRSAQKAWDSELDLYRSARAQGIQPSSTKRPAIERALKISDKTGTAFDAGA
jgi:hypothetical protein